MQFNRIGSLDIVTRVTGPTHHFLGLETVRSAIPLEPALESVSVSSAEVQDESPAANDTLYREVLAGLEAANRRRNESFQVRRIRFCREDRFVPGVYQKLTEALVDHFDLGRPDDDVLDGVDDFVAAAAIELFQELDFLEQAA